MPLTTLVPAFVLSELRSAFIIGFVIFVPFLVIDLVVAAALMSMGMMMLPPVTVSLPFKLLLFVLVDGWGLVARRPRRLLLVRGAVVTDTVVMEILGDALVVGAKLAAPVLLTALVVGFTIALFQSVTQMQEMTISFVPKAAAVGAGAGDQRALDDADDHRLHARTCSASIPAIVDGG